MVKQEAVWVKCIAAEGTFSFEYHVAVLSGESVLWRGWVHSDLVKIELDRGIDSNGFWNAQILGYLPNGWTAEDDEILVEFPWEGAPNRARIPTNLVTER